MNRERIIEIIQSPKRDRFIAEVDRLLRIPCRCEECWTDRGMHDPRECMWEMMNELRELISEPTEAR